MPQSSAQTVPWPRVTRDEITVMWMILWYVDDVKVTRIFSRVSGDGEWYRKKEARMEICDGGKGQDQIYQVAMIERPLIRKDLRGLSASLQQLVQGSHIQVP